MKVSYLSVTRWISYVLLFIFSIIFLFHITCRTSFNPTHIGIQDGLWSYYSHAENATPNVLFGLLQALLSDHAGKDSIIYEFGIGSQILISTYWLLLTVNMIWLLNILNRIRKHGVFQKKLDRSIVRLAGSFLFVPIYRLWVTLFLVSRISVDRYEIPFEFNWMVIFLIILILFLVGLIKQGAILRAENDLTI